MGAGFWKPFVIRKHGGYSKWAPVFLLITLKADGLQLLFSLNERGLGPPRGRVKEGTEHLTPWGFLKRLLENLRGPSLPMSHLL